jgi:hypothetical protein
MHLSFINANILHQVLEDDTNIVYNPTNKLFDNILYLIDFRFFVFGDYVPKTDNCTALSPDYIDLYNYDIAIFNGIVNASQQTVSKTLHVNTLIFEHDSKNNSLKKEDLLILNNKTKGIKKIFFDQTILNSWNQSDSIYLPYGIPTNVFKNNLEYNDRKDILIYGNPMLSQQLYSHFNNMQKSCSILDCSQLTIEELNKKFNNYKVVINLYNDNLLSLAALAAGCHVITLGNTNSSPVGIYSKQSIEQIVQTLNDLLTNQQGPNNELIQKYLEDNHNFDLFKMKLSDLIRTTAKREAFIL